MRLLDSFLVEGGRIVAPAAHRERMLGAALAAFSGCDPREVEVTVRDAYARAARVLAADAGHLAFPRISMSGPDAGVAGLLEAEVEVRPWHREDLHTHARLCTLPRPDSRAHPTLKGPDFAWQSEVRAWAQEHGAADALLPDQDPSAAPGSLSESAFGSILWWQDGILNTSASEARLPSVTEREIVRLSQADGITVNASVMTSEVLRAADSVWLLSSLHTVREVTHLDGFPLATRVSGADMTARLWEQARPVQELAA